MEKGKHVIREFVCSSLKIDRTLKRRGVRVIRKEKIYSSTTKANVFRFIVLFPEKLANEKLTVSRRLGEEVDEIYYETWGYLIYLKNLEIELYSGT